MAKLKAKGLKCLKGFHLVAVSCWVGGSVALILLYFLKNGVTDGNVLYGTNQSIHHVDLAVVVIPGALGCLITGLIYSSFSNWGFLKHTWLIIKLVVTIVAILFGTFSLGSWETAMMDISGQIGISSLCAPAYLYNENMNLIVGSIQVFILMVIIFISILKPWKSGKTNKSAA